MKAKLILTVFGVLGLVLITGCTCTQKTSLRCLPCENAKQVTPCEPAPAPVALKPASNCLPCEQKKQMAQVQYVAPTPTPTPVVKRDCLECVDGQPDYSEYQWR